MPVSADIQQNADFIRHQRKAQIVRDSIADGLVMMSDEVDKNNARQDSLETDMSTVKKEVLDAIKDVGTATTNANTAAESANTAASNANSVINEAETATNNANIATDSANKITEALKVCEAYSPDHTYYMYNKAIYQGSTFQCCNPNVGGIKGITPIDDSTNWICIALRGQDGTGGDMFKHDYDSNGDGIVDDSDKLGGQASDYYAKQADLTSISKSVSDISKAVTNLDQYSIYRSGFSNGVYATLQLKRKDGTLFVTSTLSGGTSPKYTMRTEVYYDTDGITVLKTLVYAVSYDSNNNFIDEVIQ
jgi:predicted peptidase